MVRICAISLEPAHEEEDQDDHQNDAHDPTWTITPAAAVRPCRDGAEKDQNQKDEQNRPEAHSRLLNCQASESTTREGAKMLQR